MEEMFKILIRNNLPPNRFYMLWSVKEGVTAPLINAELEYKILKRDGWILEDGKISAEGKRVIKQAEAYFKVKKKKTSTQLMGNNFEENIKKYNELFPKIKFPSGKAARSALGNLESAFRWFFQNYEYDWDLIFKATNVYLDEREAENWNYSRNSQYFVRKQNADKTELTNPH